MRLQEIVDQRVEENKMLWLAQGNTQCFDRGSRDTKIAAVCSFLVIGLSAQQVALGTGC